MRIVTYCVVSCFPNNLFSKFIFTAVVVCLRLKKKSPYFIILHHNADDIFWCTGISELILCYSECTVRMTDLLGGRVNSVALTTAAHE